MGVGKVTLVGAGPGSPDLITVRGLRALRRADVVVIDGLLPRGFLESLGIPLGGKTVRWLGEGDRKSQAEINGFVCRAAREGKTVVRLKGGDPLVFGRGAEEMDFLTHRGVPWEVVPGLSAVTAAATGAAMPLTDRRAGRSFAAVTARRAGGGLNTSYPCADSLVVFMGVAVLDEVAAVLLRDGRPPDTPAAVIERASQAWERRLRAPLARIAAAAREAGVRSPAVLLVGPVASRRDARPTILYTGLDPSNFRCLGDVLHWPALRVVPDENGRRFLPAVLFGLRHGRFDWVVFTSRIGVRSFFAGLAGAGLDARALGRCRIAAAGAGTAELLGEHGLRADAVPGDAGSAGILNVLPAVGSRVLLVQGTHAPARLRADLRRRGCSVTRLALHRVEMNPELGRPLPEHDVVYFASPSGVRAYCDAYGEAAFRRDVWCIGKVTLEQVRQLGFDGKVVNPHVSENANAAVPAV